ncbi:uncharacterized protein LOC112088958 [Eutrema salsugineum]|uniref:uncharacterized protein LOC112088958 n=1 Tax=Eutrema salsugineum TaxID=72664 RepID=UPI000CED398F|nr:uncharacterized protein LOC112088958 [Eutrema salsugineum]
MCILSDAEVSVECWSMGNSDARRFGPEEDSGNSDSQSEEEEDSQSGEEEKDSSEPEWDKDSYDGREYHSAEKEDTDEEADLKWRRYKRQLIETKGFFVDPENKPPYFSMGILPLVDLDDPFLDDEGPTTREFCADLAILCLDKFNQHQGSSVQMEQVLWVNYFGGSRQYFYITFVAKEFESPDAPLVEYQAKVLRHTIGKTYPILCRPSPNPTWMREKLKLK